MDTQGPGGLIISRKAMREQTARKVTSAWSAFRLGMKRPELTLVAVGEWSYAGRDEWGIVIRDLRTGEERIVFEEAEWKRIQNQGLPPTGTPFGEPLSKPQTFPRISAPLASDPANDYQPMVEAAKAMILAPRDTATVAGKITVYLRRQLANRVLVAETLHKQIPALKLNLEQVDTVVVAVMKGTPQKVSRSWDFEGGLAPMAALVFWIEKQPTLDIESPLRDVLAGKLNIDLSSGYKVVLVPS